MTATGEHHEPSRLRVLVADDNKDAADSLAQVLASWKHEARVAYDGLAALELARRFQPEVAILDLGLPTMDGYQVALNLRQDPALKGIALIAITGHDWKDAEQRSREYGFDQHLVKPVDLHQLRGLLVPLKPRSTPETG
jgi:CheY-like chemotaxis protein